MKTINYLRSNILFPVLILAACLSPYSCSENIINAQEDKYLSSQLKDIPTSQEVMQYDVSINWQNRNLDGSYLNMNIATAQYTYGLDDGYVKWNNVRTALIQDTTASPSKGDLLGFAEGFIYKVEGDNIFKEELYKNIPDNHKDLIKWFVWDAVAIETYGLMYLDSLQLNVSFRPVYFNKDLAGNIENWGTIELKSLELTWTGVTKLNDTYCAVIQYKSFFNPVHANTNGMEIESRSLYWGTILVSFDKRQIVYGTINEDMPLKITTPGVTQKQLINLQRQVEFKKVN